MMIETVPTLRGVKVLLRPFTKLDIDDTYIGWLNDPDVVRFSNQRFIKHDRESSRRYFNSFEGTENLFMIICRLSDNLPIGTMTAYVSRHHGTADIGIMIGNTSIWGLGYGQDAWNTFTSWLLVQKGIRKLTAGTLACNLGMVSVMERSGMDLEAVRKAQEIVEKFPVDILYYAKFNGS